MVFNLKGGFFLNLDEKAPEKPVSVAPVVAKPEAKPAAAKEAPAAKVAPAASAAPAAAAVSTPSAPVPTTAEAIAAELAAAQATRPAISTATFAPECVVAGGALPTRRRRGGANLAGFRSMAGSLFGKK